MNSSIYLIGFMGSGKTTIGNLLAKKLGHKSIDLDEYIVGKMQMSIPELFSRYGEDYFRQVEWQCLRQVGEGGPGIICTGGGIVKLAENRELLKKQCCIYLNVDFETLYQRIAKDTNRPLATDKKALKQLYDERQRWYEEVATYTIRGTAKTPLQVVEEILQYMK